jgi:hypothetical protein
VSLYRTAVSCPRLAKENTRVTKISQVTVRLNIYAGMYCMPAVWGCIWWLVSFKEPLDVTKCFFKNFQMYNK